MKWNVQHAMCHPENTMNPGLSLQLYASLLCTASQSWKTETEGVWTIFCGRPFQLQIVHGLKEYWCTFKFDCGTRYACVLQCLDSWLIGVMHLFTSIDASLFLILNSIVRCWYSHSYSSEVHLSSQSISLGLEQFLWCLKPFDWW